MTDYQTYYQQQLYLLVDTLYVQLKSFDKQTLPFALIQEETLAHWRAENVCLTTAELLQFANGLQTALNAYQQGDFDDNIVGRGILPLPLSSVLEQVEQQIKAHFVARHKRDIAQKDMNLGK
jgi:hypothetical protein